jgi:hypothetical protein
MARSQYLSSLNGDQRTLLEQKLLNRQSGKCFICDEPVDLVLHKGQIDIDHIDPLAEDGLDAENNFALTHASCNRSKGAANLAIARRLAEFERLQELAQREGRRGANLGDVLLQHDGAQLKLRLRRGESNVEFGFPEVGDNSIHRVPLYRDKLSGMDTFFAVFPLKYIHHDDRINPRSIGENIRGLIEEFMMKRPQLHVGLAWWAPDEDGSGKVKLFDGQHKAAAQILLGIQELPVRVFVQPDLDVLLQANTNAGGKLRQVAFDVAVMRHLGSSLYVDRVKRYRSMRGLAENDYSFSENDLVRFFRGERREMERYIIDAQRDMIARDQTNKMLEFLEYSGKSFERPLSYLTIERSFFREFLYKKALDNPIDEGLEQGVNPRMLEREQMVQLMNMFAEVFFEGNWDPDIGGRQLENKLDKGEAIPEGHVRAWRVAREEVMSSIVRWIRLVMANFYAYTGKVVHEDRLLHTRLPDELWTRLRNFLESLSQLPCWVDKNLSKNVFGPKQNFDFWERVFNTGKSPTGIQILADPLDINKMIKGRGPKAEKHS